MNATILPFKRVQKPRTINFFEPGHNYSTSIQKYTYNGSMQRPENPGPSLQEMCAVLRKNYAVLDETDRSFLFLITRVCNMGNRAKIETVMGCRAFAWSMLGRYGLMP